MAAQDSNKLFSDLFNGIALNISFSLLERAMADEESALDVGLNQQDVTTLMSLNPCEYSDMVRALSHNIISISVDTDSVHRHITHYHEKRRQDKLLISLMRHGASNAQIQAWFNLSYREMQNVRKANLCPAEAGKNRILGSDEAGELSTFWLSATLKYQGHHDVDMLACLDVADKYGVPVSLLDQLEIRKQDLS